MRSDRHAWARQLLLVPAALFLLAGTPAALAQVDYAGLPPSPPVEDPYVGTYVVPSPSTSAGGPRGPRTPAPLGGSGGGLSVARAALGDGAQPVEPGNGRLVTGSDLAMIAVLGLGAAVAFAVLTGRFRSL